MVLLSNFETSSHTMTTQTSYIITHIVVSDVMHTERDENKCNGTVSDGDD
jgi:hypothetical protein